jgi:signal transduction histidine kinase
MRGFFIFLAIFILSLSTLAQNHYTVRSYSTENGMPSNGVKGLQWDDDAGFLWIATEAGIVRYNGIDFRNFTNENTPELTSERMLFLVRSYEGRIFTSDQALNIFTVNKNRLEFYMRFPRKTNNLFLISASQSLYRNNIGRKNRQLYYLPFDQVIHLTDTSCYLRKGSDVYFYSDHSEKKLDFPELKNDVQSVFRIDSAFFIRDVSGKLFRLDTGSGSLMPADLQPGPEAYSSLNEEKSTLYWENGMSRPVLFSGNRAWQLVLAGNRIALQLIAEDVPQNAFINFVQYSEKKHTLFIGTDSKGLIMISENKVTPLRKEGTGMKERNSYYGQIELDNGNVLTNEGQVIGPSKKIVGKMPFQGSFLYSVFRTRDSLLWYTQVDTSSKLSYLRCYDYRSATTKVYKKLAIGSFAIAAVDGRHYLADENGIGALTGDSIHYLHHFDLGLSSSIYDMQEIEPGILFIATCKGMLRFDTHTSRLDTLFSQDEYCVRTIWKYGDYVFFGTYGRGFFIWKKGKTKALPLDKNKYLLYTHCFLPDGYGFCWISTNRGLFKARLADMIDAYEHGAAHVYYHYYGMNDGMDITEMNGGCVPCALKLSSNTLSFPTMDGLLWVDPQRPEPALPTGEIYIDEFTAGSRSINPDSIESAFLPAGTSEILIRLEYSAWSNKENIYIEYQLNDMKGWKPMNAENENLIRFSNLPSGSYVVRFRKLNGFGINNYSYKELHFSINTPWYQRWWFDLVIAAVILGMFFAIFHLRTRHLKIRQQKLEKQVAEKTSELLHKNEALEKTNSIKTRLISIISHDIVTPLKFVTVAGKNLLEKREQMPEELQRETIQEMTNTSQELQLLSTNILNWIKYQNENRRMAREPFNVCELVDGVFSILKSMASQKHLVLENHVDRDLVIVQYYEPLKILIYNLVSNAISFSNTGSIVVGNQKTETETVITVKDQGVGMTQEQIANILSSDVIISSANIDNRKGNGLGYLIIKDLLKMMSATVKINSEKGKGTLVTVVIPAS